MANSLLQYKNNAKSAVNMGSGLAQAATTLTVDNGSKFPASGDFMLTIWDSVTYPDPMDDSGMEIVRATARIGNDITIVRAQEGTADVAHSDDETVALLFTAGTMDERLIANLVAKTSAYTLTDADFCVTADAVGGDFTLTLPTAAGRKGKRYIIKNISDVWGEDVTVDGNGSETIDGATTYILYGGQFETLEIVSDGNNWRIV
jgi:hypothetical protein